MPDPADDAARQAAAIERLDAITRRLRRECPWDREQDERSIVPHTVEEAYELADAARSGDDAKLRDELGDVLFQVHFLALLLEERGSGDLGAVAEQMAEKLIRRHPHVFGDLELSGSGEVLANWDRIKREQEGRSELFGDIPENLPALLYARKIQRRALSRAPEGAELGALTDADHRDTIARLQAAVEALALTAGAEEADAGPGAEPDERAAIDAAVGELLFLAVDLARRLHCDPELALRATAGAFRAGVGDA